MSAGPARTRLAGVALIALATTLMLQGIRVFVSYLVFVIDQSQRVELASIAFGVFLSIGLGGPLTRLLGARRALLSCAALCGLARLTLQFWEAPTPRGVLGALVVVSWGWLLLAALDGGLPREAVAQGVTLGLGLDVAVRIAFRSLDLPWDPTLAQHVAALLLVGGLLLAAWLLRDAPVVRTAMGSNLPLIAVGPGLALFHLMAGNLGYATVSLGDASRAFPKASALLALGIVCGAAVAVVSNRTARLPWQRHVWSLLLSAALCVLIIRLMFPSESALGSILTATINLVLLHSALLFEAPAGWLRRATAPLCLTLGALLQAAILFAYYSATSARLPLYVALLALLVFSYLGRFQHRARDTAFKLAWWPAALVASLLALACAWQFATWDTPHARAAQLGDEFTVMTYNLQSGFARDHQWSLEAQARTIEAQQPDIVILEEVSRGWLVTAGNDELLWLSQRLNMPYVWGQASADGLWGNAILSRVALSEQGATKFASTQNLKRGAVRAQLLTPAGELWIYGTHLDNPTGAGAVRREQVDELLRYMGANQPAILGGDFNATPTSDVLAALLAANFSDAGAQLGRSATTSDDGKRIDYLLPRGQLTVLEARIPDVWTSDHRPFVVRVRVAR